jgi:pimeloyl-ACP methyl ester carboxylesterase
MKPLLALLLCCTTLLAAEPVKAPVGLWMGVLKVGPIHLRMGLKVESPKADEVKATLISIDQGRVEIPFDSAEFKDGKLTMKHKAASITYTVTPNDKGTALSGDFKQGDATFPLPMDSIKELPTDKRPQTPKAPFPYDSEDLKFENETAKIKLAGTLTKPKGDGPFPVVVMISGSGPQDRDETLFNHKPFLVIADHLARNGVACLRYDDRGVAKSAGKFADATSADFATDAYAAVQYLKTRKEIDSKKIGLCGHSEGGMIAPMVAAEHPDDIGFIILLAGPGVPGSTIIFEQIRDFSPGADEKKKEKDAREFVDAVMPILHSKGDRKEVESQLKAKLLEMIAKEPKESDRKQAEAALPTIIARISDPWLRWFVTFDPATSLAKVKCPILALNGDKDVQVKTKQNFEAIESALTKAGHKNHKLVSYKNLNHLFQNSKTGALSEYGQIEETMAKEVLDELTTWLKAQK